MAERGAAGGACLEAEKNHRGRHPGPRPRGGDASDPHGVRAVRRPEEFQRCERRTWRAQAHTTRRRARGAPVPAARSVTKTAWRAAVREAVRAWAAPCETRPADDVAHHPVRAEASSGISARGRSGAGGTTSRESVGEEQQEVEVEHAAEARATCTYPSALAARYLESGGEGRRWRARRAAVTTAARPCSPTTSRRRRARRSAGAAEAHDALARHVSDRSPARAPPPRRTPRRSPARPVEVGVVEDGPREVGDPLAQYYPARRGSGRRSARTPPRSMSPAAVVVEEVEAEAEAFIRRRPTPRRGCAREVGGRAPRRRRRGRSAGARRPRATRARSPSAL